MLSRKLSVFMRSRRSSFERFGAALGLKVCPCHLIPLGAQGFVSPDVTGISETLHARAGAWAGLLYPPKTKALECSAQVCSTSVSSLTITPTAKLNFLPVKALKTSATATAPTTPVTRNP